MNKHMITKTGGKAKENYKVQLHITFKTFFFSLDF